jgi:hypothetical protein
MPSTQLENRYIGDAGKVKSQSKYLGQNHLVALEKMVDAGEISKSQFIERDFIQRGIQPPLNVSRVHTGLNRPKTPAAYRGGGLRAD